jgi:hypothetical protein
MAERKQLPGRVVFSDDELDTQPVSILNAIKFFFDIFLCHFALTL